MLPHWVQHLEEYGQAVVQLLDSWGVLDDDRLRVEKLGDRELYGEGYARSWSFEPTVLTFHRWPEASLKLHVVVSEVTSYDGDLLRLEHDDYGYHFRVKTMPIIWRYDLHQSDHHKLGTRYHVHYQREDDIRPSGEVDLWEVMEKIEQHFAGLPVIPPPAVPAGP